VIETRKLFQLFYTILPIWKHLEAFGSIWKHLEADCFRCFALSWHWKDEKTKPASFQILPKQWQ